jgi:hypothetical protein
MALQVGERVIKELLQKGGYEVNVMPQGSPNDCECASAQWGWVHTRGALPLGELEVLTITSTK